MVPLRAQSPDWVRRADEAPHRSTAFRHATLHGRPGLWGDDPDHPTSALWLRGGDEGTWEAFGAGRPSPAVGWLSRRSEGRPITLLAPASWEGPLRMLGGRIEVGASLTLQRPDPAGSQPSPRPKIRARRLTLEDAPAFAEAAPTWALRGWGDFATMLAAGLAVGVPTPGGFASLAWTYESDLEHDKVGVATLPRFRNLGLGRAAASALVFEIVEERRRHPLWVTTPANAPSIALARSLGFSAPIPERTLTWSPARN